MYFFAIFYTWSLNWPKQIVWLEYLIVALIQGFLLCAHAQM